jgi:hypothetical protein
MATVSGTQRQLTHTSNTYESNGSLTIGGNLNINGSGTVDGRDIAVDGVKLDGIATGANNYSLPAGTSSERGGFKIGYPEDGQNYPVEVSSEQMFVTVPWVDTIYTLTSGDITGALGFSPISTETDDQTLDEVLAQGNTSDLGIDVGAITGSALTIDTNTLFVDSTNNRVGIGTTSPAEKLDVDGNALVRGDIVSRDAYPSVYVDHSGTVMGGIRADSTNKLELKTLTTAPLSFQVNASEKMRIISSGNVGIGTTSPTAQLESIAPDGNKSSFRLGRSDSSSIWDFNHAGGDLRIYNSAGSGSDILLGVDSAGTVKNNNVGIGTSNPTKKLSVNGDISSTGVITAGGTNIAEVGSWLHVGRSWSFSGLPFFNATAGSTAVRLDGAFMANLQTSLAASQRAQAVFGAAFNDISGYSGAGTNYSRAIGVSIRAGFYIGGQDSAKVILAVGLASTSGVYADADPISNYGFGVEFRRGSGIVYEWRVFGHNGTSLSASSWSSSGILYSFNPRTIAIYSDGSGNITAYTALYGSTNYTTITTTGGPTATGGTSTTTNFAGLRVNTNASGYVTGAYAQTRVMAVNFYAE